MVQIELGVVKVGDGFYTFRNRESQLQARLILNYPTGEWWGFELGKPTVIIKDETEALKWINSFDPDGSLKGTYFSP